VARELVLVKVRANTGTRSEIVQIADIFRAKIVNLTHESLIIELTGTDDKINALLGLLEPFGILELARTGRLAFETITQNPNSNLRTSISKPRFTMPAKVYTDKDADLGVFKDKR